MKSLFTQKKRIYTAIIIFKNANSLFKIIRRLEINPWHIPTKRMQKLTSCTHAYEKDFLFISSVLDPKTTNKHMTRASKRSPPENEPVYEKVVYSSSCNELFKVILLKSIYQQLQSWLCFASKYYLQNQWDSRGNKNIFSLSSLSQKKIESKFCTSDHFQPKASQQCMLNDLVTKNTERNLYRLSNKICITDILITTRQSKSKFELFLAPSQYATHKWQKHSHL